MRITLPESDPHYKMKIRFLGGKEDQARREYQVPSNYREKKCKELFSFLRFIHARDSELMTLSSAESGFRLGEIQPMSIRNELAVLQHLGRAAKEMMARFDTTLEEDNKLLEGETLPMFSNERNCVIMRRLKNPSLPHECVQTLEFKLDFFVAGEKSKYFNCLLICKKRGASCSRCHGRT